MLNRRMFCRKIGIDLNLQMQLNIPLENTSIYTFYSFIHETLFILFKKIKKKKDVGNGLKSYKKKMKWLFMLILEEKFIHYMRKELKFVYYYYYFDYIDCILKIIISRLFDQQDLKLTKILLKKQVNRIIHVYF